MGESMKYSIIECFEVCENDDIPYIENGYNSSTKMNKKNLMQKPVNKPPMMSPKDVLRDDWQIIRSDPKVLSAKELAGKKFDEIDESKLTSNPTVNATYDDLLSFAMECEQNDRKRTQPLIDAVKEWAEMVRAFHYPSLHEESKAIIKALETLEECEV